MEKIKKLYVTEGCVNWCWEINDKPLDEYAPSERRDILHQLIDMCSDEDIYNMTQEAMKSACEAHGEYEFDDKPCECCGDYTYTWKWEDKENE